MRKTLFISSIAALALVSSTAGAELRITLTIDGDVSEMIAVLEQLQLLGLGVTTPEAEDPLKLRVESVHEQDVGPAEATEAPPQPVLALTRPTALPATVAPGGNLTLTVAVIDERRAVDTMSATMVGTGLAFDLFDNGTHGDETPADGVWTTSITIPPETGAGEYEVSFIVYDGAGNPLTSPTPEGGGSVVTASTMVTVAIPETPAPPETPETQESGAAPETTPASE